MTPCRLICLTRRIHQGTRATVAGDCASTSRGYNDESMHFAESPYDGSILYQVMQQ